jgi:hypothetical protein
MRAANTAYGALQAGVNSAETAGNIAGRAGNVANVLSGGSRLAPMLQTASKYAAPVQAGLMGLEAGRLALDPEYRANQMAQHEQLGQQGAMAGLGRGLTAPISTITGTAGDLWSILNTGGGESGVRAMQGMSRENQTERERLKASGMTPQQLQTAMFKFRQKNNNL